MTRGAYWLLTLLSVTAVLSGIATVHAKYLTRIHFVQLQELRTQRDALDVEWNRLRLEEAALSSHVRVERKARDELGMYPPRIDDTLLIEETGDGRL
jgi:cell division protein FtsL